MLIEPHNPWDKRIYPTKGGNHDIFPDLSKLNQKMPEQQMLTAANVFKYIKIMRALDKYKNSRISNLNK